MAKAKLTEQQRFSQQQLIGIIHAGASMDRDGLNIWREPRCGE